jgi:hypothetical protein
MKLVVLGAGLQGTAATFDMLRNPAIETVGLADADEVPEFKRRHTRRTAIVLSTFAGILSGLAWLLVQRLD